MVRVIFDTNFWSYLAKSGRGSDFEKLERDLGLITLLPPSILLEAAKTNNPSDRLDIFREMLARKRQKLRTEVDLEAEELGREIKRLRPHLSKIFAKTKRLKELRQYWTVKIWNDCLRDPEFFYRNVQINNSPERAEQYATQQKEFKKKVKNWDVNKARPTNITSRFIYREGQPSNLVDFEKDYEAWRVYFLQFYSIWLNFGHLPLNHNDRTIVDWCETHFKVEEFLGDQKGYYQFWLEEVSLERMPRHWLVWALFVTQTVRKIGRGNAHDQQHASYLVDADFFFTADRRYYSCLDVIYKENVVAVAKPVLVSSNIDSIFDEIEWALS